jgi:hypothetical protein
MVLQHKSSNVLSYRHNHILYLVVFKTYENHIPIFEFLYLLILFYMNYFFSIFHSDLYDD